MFSTNDWQIDCGSPIISLDDLDSEGDDRSSKPSIIS